MFWKTVKLAPSIVIKIDGSEPLFPIHILENIETLWLEIKSSHPNLFNGKVFTVTQIHKTIITGYWTSYKYVMAQNRQSELYSILAIRSLAVSGLIVCPEGIIIGKRSHNAVYLPNYWQSPPAGSVEYRRDGCELSIAAQIYAESDEELGLNSRDFTYFEIVSATEHEKTHIIDIGILLKTPLSFKEICKRWESKGNLEYSNLICIQNINQLPDYTVPTTKYLANYWLS